MRDNELREEVRKLKKDLVYNESLLDDRIFIYNPPDMPKDTARKVQQLEKELKALYELLGVIKENKGELLKKGKKEAVIGYPRSIQDILRENLPKK